MMLRFLPFALVSLVLYCGLAQAQTYPAYDRLTVTDQAGLLSPQAESDLHDRLSALQRDTGVEMAVLTLLRQSEFDETVSLETFATDLFNHWGIGDAARNDGVLVLVLREDRAMRIELGAAYGRDWDAAAQDVIDTVFLPEFRDGAYETGILQGSGAVIDTIVQPFLAGMSAPEAKPSGRNDLWIVVIGMALVGVVGLRRVWSDWAVRIRVCPQCGHRGLRARRSIAQAATTETPGRGRRVVSCPNCDYAREQSYAIARLSSGSGGGFGGGHSGGGGASGRW